MARDQETITLTEGVWTQLTNADVTNITLQILSGAAYIRFTTDATTPTEVRGQLWPAPTGVLNIAISELSNLSGADRVWAKPAYLDVSGGLKDAVVYVDHA